LTSGARKERQHDDNRVIAHWTADRRRPHRRRIRWNARSYLSGEARRRCRHLAQTETFGPVVSVIKFSDEAEAVRIANDTPYGLNAFVQTTDLTRAHRVARQLESGSVWINTFSDISPQGPYGGYKQSGFGRTGGLEGLQEFLQIKNIRIAMQ
jgi:acyl-CoA reductase-like NAD-dependent aldehyde dehydrogenase